MGLRHSPKIVTDGLVFNFDAANIKCYTGSGSTCTEIIQNNTGEIFNSPPYSTNLKGYFSFATDDSIQFPNKTELDTQTPSVEVWARTNATTQNGFWFEKGTVNSQYSLFQEGATIRWRHRLTSGALVNVSPTTSSYINTTDWFHIVGTWTDGDQKVYINGVQVASGTTSGTIATSAGGMSIGAYGGYTGGNGYFYNGDISCVRVYNKVLSPQEIRQNYQALRGRYNI